MVNYISLSSCSVEGGPGDETRQYLAFLNCVFDPPTQGDTISNAGIVPLYSVVPSDACSCIFFSFLL